MEIGHQHLLKLLRIGVLQLEQKADYRVPRWNVREVGNNRYRGLPRIPAGPYDLDQVAAGRNKRDPVERHAHFDDLDGLITRHVFGDENVYLALHKIIHHQFLAGELFVQMQDIDHIAVWKLEPNRRRRARRSRRICRLRIRYLGSWRWLGTLRFSLSQN